MNEKFQETDAGGRARAPQCERAEQLVAYLYGEADPAGRKSFEQHMHDCAACREEFAAFGDVRCAVGDWRAEALGILPSFAAAGEASAAHVLNGSHATAPRRSALAALREFFALSPLWLRAASVAAAVVVCALAVLTVARTEVQWDSNGIAFRTGVEERIVEKRVEVPVKVGVSQEEVEQLSAGYRRELDELRSRLQQNEQTKFQVASVNENSTRRAASASDNAARPAPRNNAAPVTPQRRSPRANIAGSDDDGIPRLYDLLGEGR